MRTDNASTALNPPAAKNITYVFSRISEHAFKISITSSLHNASLFFLNGVFQAYYDYDHQHRFLIHHFYLEDRAIIISLNLYRGLCSFNPSLKNHLIMHIYKQ